jgi:hypothetical protein
MCPACVVAVVIGAVSVQSMRRLAKPPRQNDQRSSVESSRSEEQPGETLQQSNSQEK